MTVAIPLTAAPIPATSSSMITSHRKELFISKKGFKIHGENTNWKHMGASLESPNIITMYQSPKKVEGIFPALTIRYSRLNRKNKLSSYIRKWKKDYARFGFSVLKDKRIKVNGYNAYLIDLVHTTSDRQLRQMVFFKSYKAVILTCRGSQDTFSKTAKNCNNLFKNFDWL